MNNGFLLLNEPKKVFLAGIGGVSMSGLAFELKEMGHSVFGCDREASESTDKLISAGINVSIGHRAENIDGAQLVVRTAAVNDNAPEIVAARERSIPVIERCDAWGAVMSMYDRRICIAGAHGKSSVTAMCTHIALEAQLDPTVTVGALLPAIGGNIRIGGKQMFIAEACEYRNSFLSFLPTVAVINNIDEDHLDFFKDLDDIKRSFLRFSELVPENGCVCANYDSINTRSALKDCKKRVVWFGLSDAASVKAANIRENEGYYSFELLRDGELLCQIALSVRGKYNVYNALSAASAMLEAGCRIDDVKRGLEAYKGIGRRFEIRGKVNGALVVDDYAHHPAEMAAAIETARATGEKRVICAFQSHTYTRTAKLFDGFVRALSTADKVYIFETYAAREENNTGISANMLCDACGAEYFDSFDELAERIARTAEEGDIVLVMGAGDIVRLTDKILNYSA